LAPLAAAGVPLLHVYGDADDVVPWDENTGVIDRRYRQLGGKITLIAKAGVGHHPHGLEDSTPIVEFIARNSPGTPQEFVDAALLPIWRTSRLTEPMFFLQLDPSAPPTAKLLFTPTKILAVTNGQRSQTFEPGRDYDQLGHSENLTLPSQSRIPFKTYDELYPLADSTTPQIGRQAGDKSRGIFFDNGHGYHDLQASVTYEFEPGAWQQPRPIVEDSALGRTRAKLRSGEPLRIFLCGDSISEGYNSSKFTQASPYCAAYGELVALALAQHAGSPIEFRNFAVGGWSTNQGLAHCRENRLGSQQPDLVIIAFGMNDVFQRNATKFAENIAAMMGDIRRDSPDTEFLLVASMLGNREWGIPIEQFALYRDELRKLASAQVSIVDMQTLWEKLLTRKSYYDLAGNGVNHPNDFGHVLYAQWILAHLIPEFTADE
ncbi:MAG: SGNH/GDSL hydrolase family protein, partial [Planctomycetales bacterium]|nr:SGNH/GDSL hydrolase family protein [Planctomycetales bacterium]